MFVFFCVKCASLVWTEGCNTEKNILIKCTWLIVNVLLVSAIELKKKKALSLDAGYWLSAAAGCETFHPVIFSSVH